ncbi:TetR/AcrR family transcriptional regulator [Phycicoccus sp. CSK15P-2]|uniref:TetR/AcrR family transcriptional regulator n=1 Tax=Phycicoccus sp. CSK15P-2 TaxID=2807627 RepID=UPI0019503DCC|nr:TetR/AcrR family transcriptional regulator [Phycicoccus sp. CSK15P-2]MBM6403535.1 TetR/AcrR family transcriptional regulator [Phycicoccus sp. CSK15P-2]
MTQPEQVVEPTGTGDEQQGRPGRKRDHSRDPEILEAALDILAECGYDGMTVDMVAARAKAGKATLYRRWPSKAHLVIDAVACMKRAQHQAPPPDTGTLRGDLVAMIRPPGIADGQRKMQVMGGLVSLLAREPELVEAVDEAITEPRVRQNRIVLERARDRGEIRADADLELVAHIGPAMASYRTLVQRRQVDREFLVRIIDEVVLPALGVPPGDPTG